MQILWIILYVACVLFANLTMGPDYEFRLPAFGILYVGTIFFAFIFTLRDKLHQYGLPTVFLAIGLALAVNTIAAITLEASWRLIAASFISIAISELADTAVYQRFMQRSWLYRALSSNAISVPLDTVLFTLLAFYGIMSWYDLGQIIWAEIVLKTLIAGVLALLIYRFRGERLQAT